MKEFKDYLRVILLHEGGYSNHSADPGSHTKYGISLRFLQRNKIDINMDGRIDKKDIVNITVAEASDIYKKYFWDKLRIEGIDNELLKLHLFDMGVNAGNGTAVKLLQKVLGTNQDGVIGKITTAEANSYPGDIVADYAKERLDYYKRITIRNPKMKVFLRGWTNRVNGTKFL